MLYTLFLEISITLYLTRRCDVCNLRPFEGKEALENHAYSTSHLNLIWPGPETSATKGPPSSEVIESEYTRAQTFCHTCAEAVTDMAGHYSSSDHKQRRVFADAYLKYCAETGHKPNHLPRLDLIRMLKVSDRSLVLL